MHLHSHAFQELLLPVIFPSNWLLSHITIIETMDRSEREMNPVAMTIINPRKEYWPSWGSNQHSPVLKTEISSCMFDYVYKCDFVMYVYLFMCRTKISLCVSMCLKEISSCMFAYVWDCDYFMYFHDCVGAKVVLVVCMFSCNFLLYLCLHVRLRFSHLYMFVYVLDWYSLCVFVCLFMCQTEIS